MVTLVKERLLWVAGVFLFASVLAYPVWLISQIGEPREFFFTGDYEFDADAGLLRALDGYVFSMYATTPPPLMMPLALLIRLPALAIAHLAGITTSTENLDAVNTRYLIGALSLLVICVTAVVYFLREQIKRSPLILLSAVGVALFVMVNPISMEALVWGHPEEILLGCALFIAAIGVWQKRTLLTAIALAAAIATKQPALLLVPTFFFMIPSSQRKRFTLTFALTSILFIFPFIASHFSAVLKQNSEVAEAGGEGSAFAINLYDALGITDSLGGTSRPLLVMFALALPLLLAWKNEWRIPFFRGVCLLVLLALARCFMDPYNIVYYVLPAVLLMGVGEMFLWSKGQHPLSRFKKIPHIPWVSFLFAIYMDQLSDGAVVRFATDTLLAGNQGQGALYMAAMLPVIMLLVLLILGKPLPRPSKARAYLYGGGVLIGAVLVAALSWANQDDRDVMLSPPDGYQLAEPQLIANSIAPNKMWWLGEEGLTPDSYLRISAYRPIIEKEKPFSLIEYGDSSGLEGVGIYTFLANKTSVPQEELKKCQEEDCGKEADIQKTKYGLAIVRDQGNEWQATIFSGKQVIYVLILGQQVYDPKEVLERLTVIDVPQKVIDNNKEALKELRKKNQVPINPE